jgi:hypothetical protein
LTVLAENLIIVHHGRSLSALYRIICLGGSADRLRWARIERTGTPASSGASACSAKTISTAANA